MLFSSPVSSEKNLLFLHTQLYGLNMLFGVWKAFYSPLVCMFIQ